MFFILKKSIIFARHYSTGQLGNSLCFCIKFAAIIDRKLIIRYQHTGKFEKIKEGQGNLKVFSMN